MSPLYTFRLSPQDAQQLAKDMEAAGYTDRTAYIKRKLFGPPGERREFATQLEVIDERLYSLGRQLASLPSQRDIEALLQRQATQPAIPERLPGQLDRHDIDHALADVGISPRTRETVLKVLAGLDAVTPIGTVSAGTLVRAATARRLDMNTIGVMIEILQEIGAMPRLAR